MPPGRNGPAAAPDRSSLPALGSSCRRGFDRTARKRAVQEIGEIAGRLGAGER